MVYVTKKLPISSPVIKVDQGQFDIARLLAYVCLPLRSEVILQSLLNILCVPCVVRTSVPIDWYHNGLWT